MNALTQFSGTPDDLKAMLTEVVNPLVIRIKELESKVGQKQDVLTIPDLSKLSGFSKNIIRSWITEGLDLSKNGKVVKIKLKPIDGISDGPYRIRWETWRAFLAQFPDVEITRQSASSSIC
jgi:hypothetical protein